MKEQCQNNEKNQTEKTVKVQCMRKPTAKASESAEYEMYEMKKKK